jgi:hypothetical protein
LQTKLGDVGTSHNLFTFEKTHYHSCSPRLSGRDEKGGGPGRDRADDRLPPSPARGAVQEATAPADAKHVGRAGGTVNANGAARLFCACASARNAESQTHRFAFVPVGGCRRADFSALAACCDIETVCARAGAD